MFNVHDIARLSRLTITPEQEPALEKQLAEILSYVDMLKTADTTSVAGYGLTDRETVFRDDVSSPGGPPEKRVALSPSHCDGMFLVPKVIGGGGEA